jgi:hypothetical protein
MKIISLFVVVAVLTFSTVGCAVLRTASGVAKRSHIGMSFPEFKRLSGGDFDLETMTPEYSVYRIDEWSGPAERRYISGAKFFHFDSNSKLTRIESRDLTPSFPPRSPIF